MRGRWKIAAAGFAIGLSVAVPQLTFLRDDKQPLQPKKVQVDYIQLVPHQVGETCPPILSHAACERLGERSR